jgi:hypothetical protein
MPTTIVPLPERPSLEQLRKQARLLQRAVRSGHPKALALVAHHQPTANGAGFSLDAAQFVLARSYGFASWPKLREHVAALVPAPEPAEPASLTLTVDNHFHARAAWADEQDVKRCTSVHPDLGGCRPLVTVHYNGVKVIAFATADGPRFCELTPTTITVSRPGTVARPTAGRAGLVFHTASGSMAGIVTPEVTRLSLERPADLAARQPMVVTNGVFVAPNAFTVDASGLVFRVNDSRTGDIVATHDLPSRAVGFVDRPAPRADRESPAGRRLAAAIAQADAPPVVDPDHWEPGVCLKPTDAEQVQLGRYGNLLGWHNSRGYEDGLLVFDFGPQQGPLHQFAIIGETITATRMYYGFANGSSGSMAVVGLINDDRVASITLSRKERSDVEAALDTGTFAIPAVEGLRENDPHAYLIVRDKAAKVLERLPYRQNTQMID